MNKRVFILSLICTLLLSNSVQAEVLTNQTVESDKKWTIQFNDDIVLDDLTKKNILIRDTTDLYYVDVTFSYGQNHKTIIVNPPQGGYKPGDYTLVICDGIHSQDNKKLKQNTAKLFNIKDNTSVTFKDKTFENGVRKWLKIPTGNISQTLLKEGYYITMRNDGITDISDVKLFPNVGSIDLSYNNISDISPLNGLNLTTLLLQNDEIKDITPLATLNKLEGLALSGNHISDISPIKNLTSLTDLSLNNNEISDISPIKNLTNLKSLWAPNNQISNISVLQNMTNLTELNLDNNQISDISVLKNLTNLSRLWLRNNKISDADKKALKIALPNCEITFE